MPENRIIELNRLRKRTSEMKYPPLKIKFINEEKGYGVIALDKIWR